MENEQPQQVWEVCSFCGRSRRDVPFMIAGLKNAFICCNCIVKCLEVTGESLGKILDKNNGKTS
jgi:hypothetical protein